MTTLAILRENLLMTAGIVAAILGIIGFLFKVYHVATRIDAALGVDKQGRTLSERMERVEHQVWPNGGSSMADQVNKVREDIGEMDKRVVAVAAQVTVIRDMLTAMVETRR